VVVLDLGAPVWVQGHGHDVVHLLKLRERFLTKRRM
jgi:hypothetical protein